MRRHLYLLLDELNVNVAGSGRADGRRRERILHCIHTTYNIYIISYTAGLRVRVMRDCVLLCCLRVCC